MKNHFVFMLSLILTISNQLKAQSIGGGAEIGIYSASYVNPENVEEEVSGTGYLSLGGVYELKLGRSDQNIIPISISYARFGTEQTLSNDQTMSHKASNLRLGLGYHYYTRSTDYTIRPFIGAGVAYEALINATYYYNEQQSGKLDWNPNAYLNIKGGIGIETGVNARIDVFANWNLGLLNRVESNTYGTFKDQVLSLGINVIFN